jgi:hypothetical protein
VAALVLLAPEIVSACAVCAPSGDNGTQGAFRLSTAFLTVLPLAVIGGTGWWLSRRIREADARNTPEPFRTSSLP